MVDLHLPVFKGEPNPPKPMSMDAYVDFVLWMWENIVNVEACRQLKARDLVNVRFKLKKT